MPKIIPDQHESLSTTGYPPPYDRDVAGRSRISISKAGGLTQYGANLITLQPGAWSSQRHWHSAEDELVVMLFGTAILVEDEGETLLAAGDLATFKAGVANGHHLQNRSDLPAVFLAVGTDLPDRDECHYPDVDMHWSGKAGYTPKAKAAIPGSRAPAADMSAATPPDPPA